MFAQTSTIGPESIPSIDYDAVAVFERHGGLRPSPSLGLMTSLAIEGSEVRMGFLYSHTVRHHRDLLLDAELDPTSQPVAEIDWQGSPFTCAIRYRTERIGFGPLELQVMIDGGAKDQDVRELDGYTSLQRVVTLASGLAITTRELISKTAKIDFKAVSGFQTHSQFRQLGFRANNLEDLAGILSPSA